MPVKTLLLIASIALAQGGGWLDVPFVRQPDEGCGAASISMVMRYWGRDSEPEPILRELYSADLKGIRAADMARYFRAHGFRAFEFEADWEDLRQQIAKGRPVIVALREGGSALHYVVVAGIERGGARVNDPARRKLLRLDRADFERRWHDGWALLAVPAEGQ